MKKKVLQIFIDIKDYEKIADQAKEERLSISSYSRNIITKEIYKKTLETIIAKIKNKLSRRLKGVHTI